MRELETALFTIMRGTSTEMKNEVLKLIKNNLKNYERIKNKKKVKS